MASLNSLEALMQEELKDIYDGEKQITKALPKLAKKASSDELRDAIEEHLRQTEEHVERLEQVFQELDMPAKGKKCEGIKGLLEEGDDMIGDVDDEATRDALIVAAAQKVEHYEIAAYGTLRTWANRLGNTNVAQLLEETLEEEKEADQKLTGIAESFVNEEAAHGGEMERGANAQGRGRQSVAAMRGTRQAAADRGAASRSRSKSSSSSRSRSR